MSEDEHKKPIPPKPWKKGQSGNPNGRPSLPAEILEARRLNRETFEDKLHSMLQTPMCEVEEVLNKRDKTKAMSIDCIAASIITHAVNDGCIHRTNFLLSKIGINPKFVEHDPLTNVTPEQQQLPAASTQEDNRPFFVVEINQNGKFVRSRPREVLLAEVQAPKAANG